VKVTFPCSSCDVPVSITLASAPAVATCPACGQTVTVPTPATVETPDGIVVETCAVCGGHELYKKKAFPHWLGMTILTGACLGFVVLNAYRYQWWAWVVLLVSAAVDGLLYLLVKDVVVCYHCYAHHRGLGRSGNKPFELIVHERYRQERLRREQMSG
jgi:hypothetical protein